MTNYKMPSEIRDLLDINFCEQFITELHCIWGFALEDFDYDSIGNVEGCSGWYEAFTSTCRKTKNDELYSYYCSLEWYDSDLFDEQLTQLLVKYKLLLPESEVDEIAKQNNLSLDDIGVCDCCYKYYNKKDMIAQDEAENEDYESLYLCLNCEGSKNVKNLTYNKFIPIKEILGITEEDYFICSKCNKIHHKNVKNEETGTCLYCNIDKVPETSVNIYYQEGIILNYKYSDSIIPKKYEYKEYESYVKYSYEDELWYGHIEPKKNKDKFKDLISFESETRENIQKALEEAVDDYLEFKKSLQ